MRWRHVGPQLFATLQDRISPKIALMLESDTLEDKVELVISHLPWEKSLCWHILINIFSKPFVKLLEMLYTYSNTRGNQHGLVHSQICNIKVFPNIVNLTLGQWGPMSSMSNWYKIFVMILANHLHKVLWTIVVRLVHGLL